MNVVAIVNTKGGVGKTTTAVGLAQALSSSGSVVVADLDPQGSASSWALNAIEEGHPLAAPVAQIGREHRPAAIPRLAAEAADGADWLILDTSPADLDRADAAIELATAHKGVVVIPTKTSALDLPRALVTIEDVGGRATAVVLLTMTRTGTKRLDEARHALSEAGATVLRSTIPLREKMAAAAEMQGANFDELTEAHTELADELSQLLKA